mgnify:CR=1 FL=1
MEGGGDGVCFSIDRLRAWLEPNADDRRLLQLFVTPLGLGGDCGVVVVGAPQTGFPAATDRLK